jgi:signal peptidase
MKKVLRWISNILVTLVALTAVAVMIFTVVSVKTLDQADRSFFGTKAFVVLSDSMSATDFSSGDIALVKEVDPSTLQVGDIISYTSQDEANYGSIVTHKIREITTNEDGETVFITYGTTTDSNDPYPVRYQDVVGKYFARIPQAGNFYSFLKSVPGYFVCIFTPFAILIVWQLISTIKLYKLYKQELRDDELANEKKSNAEMLEELQSLREQLAAAQNSNLQEKPE